ncbi:hypothetical protein [Cyclobacterium roseum]|uniref:hypothetical protein n=1 Tax=Cyclobacterium roseum TaxID=2666137 RepID=UPI0013920AAE|nr:hypothetical protein [Cyclobacterium roseum]
MKFLKKSLIAALPLLFCFLNVGCSVGEDNDVGSCSVRWSIELQDEINAMSQAAIARAQNPGPTTCENFRSASEAFLEALRPYGNCSTLTGQSRSEWQNEMDEAETRIQELDCSEDT